MRKAIAELKAEGVADAHLVSEKVSIRGWRGSGGEGIRYGISEWDKPLDYDCDAGIIFNEGKYDIGLKKKSTANGDVYVPFMENSWSCPYRAENGAEKVGGEQISTHTSHALSGPGCDTQVGRLSQRYALLMAERNARTKGIMTRRVKGAKGQLQLVCTVR